ncbi:MAG: hypothetical protein AB8B93_07130, partial [Pseudomonadales bacterium]
HHDDFMQITRTWYNFFYLAGAVLGALAFNAVWLGKDFVGILFSDKPLLLKLFASLFVFIGVVSAYYAIALRLNKTRILVNQDLIAISHRPIPWFGNKQVQAAQLQQLYVKRTYWGSSNDNPRYTYSLVGLTGDGKKIKLLSGMQSMTQVSYVEQELEKYLGIVDQAVAGEFGRKS